jgi:hypothetical protein
MEVLPVVHPPDDRLLYVIDYLVVIDQVEADPRCAFFTLVGGTRPFVFANQVWQAITHSFNVPLEAMVITVAKQEDFIVFLPDVATADQVSWRRVLSAGAPRGY